MLQLVHLMFTDIRKDQETYDVIKNQYISMYANYASNPKFICSDSLYNTMYNHNPMLSMMDAEDFVNANYDRMLEIAKERTANAADFTFNFVGSFDPEVLRPLVEKYIATLPANTTREKVDAKPFVAKGQTTSHCLWKIPQPAYMLSTRVSTTTTCVATS